MAMLSTAKKECSGSGMAAFVKNTIDAHICIGVRKTLRGIMRWKMHAEGDELDIFVSEEVGSLDGDRGGVWR